MVLVLVCSFGLGFGFVLGSAFGGIATCRKSGCARTGQEGEFEGESSSGTVPFTCIDWQVMNPPCTRRLRFTFRD